MAGTWKKLILYLIIASAMTSVACTGTCHAASRCVKCHEKLFNTKISEHTVHRPFMEQRCDVCHEQKLPQQAAQETTTWKMSGELNKGTNLIPLSALWQNYEIVVRLQDMSGLYRIDKKLIFDRLEGLKTTKYMSQNEILNPQVNDVHRDIFISASLTWDTPCPSRCEIHYGTDGSPDEILYETTYSIHHHIEIQGLKKGREYHAFIRAEGINHETTESQQVSFNTKKETVASSHPSKGGKPAGNSGLTINKAALVKIGSKPFLMLDLNRNALVRLGLNNSTHISHDVSDTVTSARAWHPKLLSLYEAGYLNCKKCHKNSDRDSHPVNIRLLPEMNPPKDFVTAMGKVTCVSCHDPHGSQYAFSLRRNNTALCQGCHKATQYAANKYQVPN